MSFCASLDVNSFQQCLQIIASALTSSAQYGHVILFIIVIYIIKEENTFLYDKLIFYARVSLCFVIVFLLFQK